MKCTTSEREVSVWGDGIDNDLSYVELLSREYGMEETSSRSMNLGKIG